MTDITPSTTLPVADRSARLMKTGGYYAAFIGLGLAAALTGPTLPGLAAHTHTSLQQISYVFSARSLGYLAGSFVGGGLYDHLPGHRLMGGGLLVMALMVGLVPVMPLLSLLAAVSLLFGIAEGTVDVGGNAMLVWVHRERVGPFMNALHFFFGVGTFIAPLIVAWIVPATGDINWAYWLIALSYLPMAIWVLRLPSPLSQKASDEGAQGNGRPLLVALLAVFFFLYVGSELGVGNWIYTYALRSHIADATTAAYLTSLFWGAFTAGRLLSIPVATRVEPRTVLIADLFGCLAGVAIILAWPGSLAGTAAGTALVGLAMAAIFPTTMSLAGQHMTLTGRATSWFFVGSSTGGMFLPWLIGQLFEPVGPRSAIWTVTASIVLSVVVLTLILSQIRRGGRPAADLRNPGNTVA